MPEFDVGPVIGQMARVAGEELIASALRSFGLSLDVVMIVRAPESESVMVMGMLMNDPDSKQLYAMLEKAFETVARRKPDVDDTVVIP